MSEHPIQGLMTTAMQSIQQMIDVNTVIGDAVDTHDGTVIIPVSRVSFGFAAGGGEYQSGAVTTSGSSGETPFGGGSGAGVSVQPVGFLVVGHDQVRLLPINGNVLVDHIVDKAPELIDQIGGLFKGDTSGTRRLAARGAADNESI